MKQETFENIGKLTDSCCYNKVKIKSSLHLELRDYVFWVGGIFLSLLPLLTASFFPYFKVGLAKNYDIIYHILKEYSLVFVTISMSVSALNYALSHDHKYSRVYTYVILIIILFGAMIYTYVQGLPQYDVNTNAVAIFNLIYFMGQFLLCSTVYLSKKEVA